MEILHGKSLTPGTARGCIHIFAENSAEHGEEKGESAEAELALFRHAVGEAEEQIRMLAVQAEATGGREAAQILEMTALIYQDEEFVKAVETQILRSGKTASCAVQNVCKDFASLLEVNASDTLYGGAGRGYPECRPGTHGSSEWIYEVSGWRVSGEKGQCEGKSRYSLGGDHFISGNPALESEGAGGNRDRKGKRLLPRGYHCWYAGNSDDQRDSGG